MPELAANGSAQDLVCASCVVPPQLVNTISLACAAVAVSSPARTPANISLMSFSSDFSVPFLVLVSAPSSCRSQRMTKGSGIGSSEVLIQTDFERV